MKASVLALISLAIFTGCAIDRFELVESKSGEAVGPFLYRSGSSVQLDGKTYRIRRLVSRDEYLKDRLKSKFVPEIDFREANVADVVQFIQEGGIVWDTDKAMANPRIQVSLLIPNERMQDVPKITFSGRHLSLYKTLEIVAKMTDLDFVIEDGHAWLKWKD